MKLRRFISAGVDAVRAFLAELKTTADLARAEALAQDDALTEPIAVLAGNPGLDYLAYPDQRISAA